MANWQLDELRGGLTLPVLLAAQVFVEFVREGCAGHLMIDEDNDRAHGHSESPERRLRDDQYARVSARHPPSMRPADPRMVQQPEVFAIVGDEDAIRIRGSQQMDVVGGVEQARVVGGHDIVAMETQTVGDVPCHLLIEVEAGHQLGRIGREARIDGALVLPVIGLGRLHRLDRDAIAVRHALHVVTIHAERADQRPSGTIRCAATEMLYCLRRASSTPRLRGCGSIQRVMSS